jgi:hypothetical protein
MAKQAPRFTVQPGWKLRFAAELTHPISWAEIASQQPLTRHLYEAHYRSGNHAAIADIVGVLGRALQ